MSEYKLKIANSRGRKPVITDIKKAYKLIDNLLVEINPCMGKSELQTVSIILFRILNHNK